VDYEGMIETLRSTKSAKTYLAVFFDEKEMKSVQSKTVCDVWTPSTLGLKICNSLHLSLLGFSKKRRRAVAVREGRQMEWKVMMIQVVYVVPPSFEALS
jgi:hypothetical protein